MPSETMIEMTLNVLTHPERLKLIATVKLVGLTLVEFCFTASLLCFISILSLFLVLNLQITMQVMMSTHLLQLIRISKMRYEIRSETLLKKKPLSSEISWCRCQKWHPNLQPSICPPDIPGCVLSLINMPLQKCYIMHYSCCPLCRQPETADTTGCSDGCTFPSACPILQHVRILDLTIKPPQRWAFLTSPGFAASNTECDFKWECDGKVGRGLFIYHLF